MRRATISWLRLSNSSDPSNTMGYQTLLKRMVARSRKWPAYVLGTILLGLSINDISNASQKSTSAFVRMLPYLIVFGFLLIIFLWSPLKRLHRPINDGSSPFENQQLCDLEDDIGRRCMTMLQRPRTGCGGDPHLISGDVSYQDMPTLASSSDSSITSTAGTTVKFNSNYWSKVRIDQEIDSEIVGDRQGNHVILIIPSGDPMPIRGSFHLDVELHGSKLLFTRPSNCSGMQLLESLRLARLVDEDCALQLGNRVFIKYTDAGRDAGPRLWKIPTNATPIMIGLQSVRSLKNYFNGYGAQWIVKGLNLQDATVKVSTKERSEILNIQQRYKTEEGYDIIVCEESPFIRQSISLPEHKPYIFAQRIIEIDEGLSVILRSQPGSVRTSYWISVIDAAMPSSWTIPFIVVSLLPWTEMSNRFFNLLKSTPNSIFSYLFQHLYDRLISGFHGIQLKWFGCYLVASLVTTSFFTGLAFRRFSRQQIQCVEMTQNQPEEEVQMNPLEGEGEVNQPEDPVQQDDQLVQASNPHTNEEDVQVNPLEMEIDQVEHPILQQPILVEFYRQEEREKEPAAVRVATLEARERAAQEARERAEEARERATVDNNDSNSTNVSIESCRRGQVSPSTVMAPNMQAILFGRTGAGKSTIANALVTGDIESEVFRCSDSARGCTSSNQKETGRGWTVTDTVGLGQGETGAVPNVTAKKMLTDFLKSVKQTYSHILYVQKATTRLTTVDEMVWLLFESIFEGAEEAFVVVFTGANERWLRDNWEMFPSYLKRQKLLVTDIPPINYKRPNYERWQRPRREKSIKKLEEDLKALFESRDLQFSTPNIVKMTDGELEEKSSNIVQFIVSYIKRVFDEMSWPRVASTIETLVCVADIVVSLEV